MSGWSELQQIGEKAERGKVNGRQEMEDEGPGICILNWYILEHFKYISNSKKGERMGTHTGKLGLLVSENQVVLGLIFSVKIRS